METDVLRIDSGRKENIRDIVTDEVILTIHLNERELLTLLCSPGNLKELSVGFLYTAGLIHSLDDIDNVFVNKKNLTSHISLKEENINVDIMFKRVYTSGCGRGMLFKNVLDLAHRKAVTGDFNIQSEKITELMKAFEKKSTTYKKTGGVHSAALSDGVKILVFGEDIGRHNAIDKIIGETLYKNLNMAESIILTSGRISSEVMYKVQKTGSPIIISRSAPTGLAIELAEKLNVTLVGFARGRRMNVYSVKERVL
ncbi:MAG: formate dehydrogenase accessory sulfurtransferase FdhD [Candidatus Latescibacteria bacterium]|jgi:FdhD protein|nr:formate dehydrogenase accessory sulfurtransferase FdhD [Candidatus Latescibacterota bacterium]